MCVCVCFETNESFACFVAGKVSSWRFVSRTQKFAKTCFTLAKIVYPNFVLANFRTRFRLTRRNMADSLLEIAIFGRNFGEVSFSSVTNFQRNIAEIPGKQYTKFWEFLLHYFWTVLYAYK